MQENEMKLFRENHKIEMRKLKDELESMPKEQKKDTYRQLKEEKDIQQAERVRGNRSCNALQICNMCNRPCTTDERTPAHSRDNLKLFFFDERFRTFCSFVIIQIHFGF